MNTLLYNFLMLGTLLSTAMASLYCTPNNCITFSVGPGTGCQWMCNYCSEQLQSTNYYFTDGVCHYESGGCVGSPISGHQYTCCSS